MEDSGFFRRGLLAYALLAGYAPPYDAVINKINALIAQYNVTLARGTNPGMWINII